MDVQICLRFKRRIDYNPLGRLGFFFFFFVWQLAVWCSRHVCSLLRKLVCKHFFWLKKPDGEECLSAILWPSIVENVNIFIMGLHSMLHFPYVVHARLPQRLLALQGGSKTWISLWLRFCGIKTGTSDKRENDCPGMEGCVEWWQCRCNDTAMNIWCELGVHFAFQDSKVPFVLGAWKECELFFVCTL